LFIKYKNIKQLLTTIFNIFSQVFYTFDQNIKTFITRNTAAFKNIADLKTIDPFMAAMGWNPSGKKQNYKNAVLA
jgi:hypothetical protein